MTNTLSVYTPKPIMNIDYNQARFQTSTIIYNNSVTTYNSATTNYGGSARRQAIGPKMIEVRKY